MAANPEKPAGATIGAPFLEEEAEEEADAEVAEADAEEAAEADLDSDSDLLPVVEVVKVPEAEPETSAMREAPLVRVPAKVVRVVVEVK